MTEIQTEDDGVAEVNRLITKKKALVAEADSLRPRLETLESGISAVDQEIQEFRESRQQ